MDHLEGHPRAHQDEAIHRMGVGAFEEAWKAFKEPIPLLGYPFHPHNMYLGLLASGGFVLLASVLFLFGLALVRAWHIRGLFSAEESPLLSAALLAAIAGQLVLGLGGWYFPSQTFRRLPVLMPRGSGAFMGDEKQEDTNNGGTG